jgi:two-component system chemotaxis response regulator CheY
MGRQMLVADDSPAIRAVITDALQESGIREEDIEIAENGEEAVSMYMETDPDVVFMDLNMPRKDGREAAEEILNENPRARIVAVTGLREDKEIVEDIRSIGAFEILQKPLRFQDIQDVLTKIEEERRGAGRIP